jgi:hypothetical protein
VRSAAVRACHRGRPVPPSSAGLAREERGRPCSSGRGPGPGPPSRPGGRHPPSRTLIHGGGSSSSSSQPPSRPVQVQQWQEQGVPRRGRSRAPARSDSHAASALHCTAWHDWVPGPPLSPRTALCLNARPSLPPSHSSQSLPAARQPPAPPVLSPSLSGSPPLPLVRR